MSIQLKIKSKHLALESKVIKFEEQKLLGQARRCTALQAEGHNNNYSEQHMRAYRSIRGHRTEHVRPEARATLLARKFIQGATYAQIEQKRRPSKEYIFNMRVVPRIAAMVTKYGHCNVTNDDVLEWINK